MSGYLSGGDGYFDEFDGYEVDSSGNIGADISGISAPENVTDINAVGGVVPTMSTTGQSGSPSLQQILGSLGGMARDLGTAVGTVGRDIRGIGPAYRGAYNNATNPSPQNRLSQWWTYSSTTDKLTVGIGLAGLYFLVKKA